MATEGEGAADRDTAFRWRCLLAAAADARACWEEYDALVRAAAEEPPREGGASRRAEGAARGDAPGAGGAADGGGGPVPGRP